MQTFLTIAQNVFSDQFKIVVVVLLTKNRISLFGLYPKMEASGLGIVPYTWTGHSGFGVLKWEQVLIFLLLLNSCISWIVILSILSQKDVDNNDSENNLLHIYIRWNNEFNCLIYFMNYSSLLLFFLFCSMQHNTKQRIFTTLVKLFTNFKVQPFLFYFIQVNLKC